MGEKGALGMGGGWLVGEGVVMVTEPNLSSWREVELKRCTHNLFNLI